MKLLKKSFSQSGQESFVLHSLGYKKKGTYIEIGAYDGKDLSNTYLLEKKYKWNGIAFDISEEFAERYNKIRRNKCINADALAADFGAIFEENGMPLIIDYLQLDIEPAENTYNCMLRIPFQKYKFRVITFEHDLYADPANLNFKQKAFEYLENHGYKRVADNVCNNGNAYEDWYVHKELVDLSAQIELLSNQNFINHFRSKFP